MIKEFHTLNDGRHTFYDVVPHAFTHCQKDCLLLLFQTDDDDTLRKLLKDILNTYDFLTDRTFYNKSHFIHLFNLLSKEEQTSVKWFYFSARYFFNNLETKSSLSKLQFA